MIYHKLAEIYDELVEDKEASLCWAKFVNNSTSGKKVLELACGSGEITIALADLGFDVLATDKSKYMIDKAYDKSADRNIRYRIMDMLNWKINELFDVVICFCDSINYLSDFEQLRYVFRKAYQCLESKGVLLFDMHHEHRLLEFKDEWDEDGVIRDISYQWLINSEYDQIVQYFNIIEDNKVYQEIHVQRVFEVDKVVDLLKECGFSVEVLNDYDIFNEELKERYFFKATKA